MYTPSAGGSAVHIGYPLPEAVWRTNHGYDPIIRKNFEWSQSPESYSVVRYMLIHSALEYYYVNATQIGSYYKVMHVYRHQMTAHCYFRGV